MDDGRTASNRHRYGVLHRAVARHGSDQAVAVGAGIDSADRAKTVEKGVKKR